MSKVLIISRTFPGYHPRKGQQTHFVEKIWKGMYDAEKSMHLPFNGYWQQYDQAFPTGETYDPLNNIHNHKPKWHTIRAGNFWKQGEFFSPRVWTGLPRRSKQLQIAPDTEIKKLWPVLIETGGSGWMDVTIEGAENTLHNNEIIATNDGLSLNDFFYWFRANPHSLHKATFEGQILCWNDTISY